jgi:outer membrane protein TolC
MINPNKNWPRYLQLTHFFTLSVLSAITFSTQAGFAQGPGQQTAKLSLRQAMQLGREKPFQVRMAQEQAAEAQARSSQALGILFPRIDLDAQQIKFDKSVNKATGQTWAPQFPAQVTTAGLQVSQPILGLLPLTLQARAASMMADVAQESAAQARRDGALLGAQSFLNAVRAQQFFKIAQSSLALVEKQKNDADALYRAGKLSQADVMRFELSVADARSQLTQANVAKQLAFISLNDTLMISAGEDDLDAPETSIFEEKNPSAPALEEVVNLALARRPELKAAQNQLKIAELTTWAARLDYSPSINAFARYDRDFEAQDLRGKSTDGTAAPLLAAKNDVRDKLAVGLQLKWQIWDWGTRWNKISETVAQRSKAEIASEQALSLLRTEVIKSYLDFKASTDALKTSLTSDKLAQEVYKLTQARFTNGQASSTDLIIAERDQARARAALVGARSEVDLAWFRLQRNMGEEPSL